MHGGYIGLNVRYQLSQATKFKSPYTQLDAVNLFNQGSNRPDCLPMQSLVFALVYRDY